MSRKGKTEPSREACGGSALAAKGLAIGWQGRVEKILSSGIDLELGKGELAVLVGPNGSGKSTLLRTLAGFQSPLRGSTLLAGKDVRRISVEERARLAACVFTDRFDSGFFSVFDIVAFGRYPYTDTRGSLEKGDLDAVENAISAVGLSALSRRRFSELSDGERQKALIARAIAQDCPLLVLDEPGAFLDAPARAWVFHLVRELAHSAGKAIVLSTHDIDLALRSADRLWLMDGNHRFSAGAPEDLVLSGRIGRAFDGGGLVFDTRSGNFRSAPEASPLAVELTGPEGVSREWARRLLERLGIAHAKNADEAAATLRIEEGEAGPLFSIKPRNSVPSQATSYEELARILSDLLSAKRL
jgi:iron complex transport system ATP-binding protein